MKYYYQATELDLITEKPIGQFNFDGYVEAEDRKTALGLARKIVNKENALRRKQHEPVEEYPASELPPIRFELTLLRRDEYIQKEKEEYFTNVFGIRMKRQKGTK